MTSPLSFALKQVQETGELPVDATAEPELFPDALSEGVLIGPISVKGVIREVDDTAAFAGSAKGRWRFECTRCLTPVELAWDAAVEASAPIDAGPLDLTEEVRQSIALAQPMKTVCRPDCKGLCPVCGKNRNAVDCEHAPEVLPKAGRARLTPRPKKG